MVAVPALPTWRRAATFSQWPQLKGKTLTAAPSYRVFWNGPVLERNVLEWNSVIIPPHSDRRDHGTSSRVLLGGHLPSAQRTEVSRKPVALAAGSPGCPVPAAALQPRGKRPEGEAAAGPGLPPLQPPAPPSGVPCASAGFSLCYLRLKATRQ